MPGLGGGLGHPGLAAAQQALQPLPGGYGGPGGLPPPYDGPGAGLAHLGAMVPASAAPGSGSLVAIARAAEALAGGGPDVSPLPA